MTIDCGDIVPSKYAMEMCHSDAECNDATTNEGYIDIAPLTPYHCGSK